MAGDEVEVPKEHLDVKRTRGNIPVLETKRSREAGRKAGTKKETETIDAHVRDHHAHVAHVANTLYHAVPGDLLGHQTVVAARTRINAREDGRDLGHGQSRQMALSPISTSGTNGKRIDIGNGVEVESGRSGNERRKRRRCDIRLLLARKCILT